MRREEYVGPWLPEPLLTDEGAGDPSAQAELADSLSLAFLVLLERLSPVERAAFLLREVFDYPYDEIAEVIGKSEGNVRQLVSRARRHVDEERPRFDVDRQAHEELTDRFIEATQSGDTEGLIELLAEDVYTYTDGGGKAQAPRRMVHGREHVARFMVGIARPDRGVSPATLHPVLVNGVPGPPRARRRGQRRRRPHPRRGRRPGDGRAHRRQPRQARAPAGFVTRAEAERTLARLHEEQGAFYAGGPREPLHEVLTEDIVWVVPGRNAIAGEYRGRDAVIDYFTRRRELADRSFRMHPGEVLVGDGDHVAVLTDGTATIDGVEHHWSTVGLYRLREGRVAACWLLPLDAAAFDAIWSGLRRR